MIIIITVLLYPDRVNDTEYHILSETVLCVRVLCALNTTNKSNHYCEALIIPAALLKASIAFSRPDCVLLSYVN